MSSKALKKIKTFSNYRTIVILVVIILLVLAALSGLVFATKTEPVVKEGAIDLAGINKNTVYLFGEWNMYESYIEPGNSLWESSTLHTINTDSLSENVQSYSLKSTIKNLDTENYCLQLYNIKYVDRIYLNNQLVYYKSESIDTLNDCVYLKDFDNVSFEITVWLSGGHKRQSSQYPLTLILTHINNAAILSHIRIVLKYILVGIYFAFALICLVMYLKNKSAIHFLLLSVSGLIRMLALESYLAPCLLFGWLGFSDMWILRTAMIFISLANILNVGVIYILYKKYMLKKTTLAVLIIVTVFLLLTLITGSRTLGLMLNISGYFLYIMCLLTVGYAFVSGNKTAGWMFGAFLIYMVSLLFFYGTRSLAGMGSLLGVYNFVCPIGEILFYAVTIFAFFVRYIQSYIQNELRIRSLGYELSDKEHSLTEAYNKLSRFEEARTKMLKDLSHDLRTPVTSVLGYLSMMASGEITGKDEVEKVSGKMLPRVRQIKEMTNSISGLMTLEQGELKMQLEKCSVSNILNTVQLNYTQRCSDAGINFVIKNNSSLKIIADMNQIMRVFDNLLSNAIRYTHSGGTITVSAENEINTVRFSVKDTGEGIPEDQQMHIFGRFFRGESSRSQSSVHQGLGLAICYEIVKAHNGTIGVTSEYGKGSEFYFMLNQAMEGDEA